MAHLWLSTLHRGLEPVPSSLSVRRSTPRWGAFLDYAGFSAVGGLWLYFYLPETIQLSLEDIAALFRDPYPAPLRGQQQRQQRHAVAPTEAARPKKESDALLKK